MYCIETYLKIKGLGEIGTCPLDEAGEGLVSDRSLGDGAGEGPAVAAGLAPPRAVHLQVSSLTHV